MAAFSSGVAYAVSCLGQQDIVIMEKQSEAINHLRREGRVRVAAYGVRKIAALPALTYFSILTSSWDVLELAIATERSVALVISPLMSLMMDQVCSLQAHEYADTLICIHSIVQ